MSVTDVFFVVWVFMDGCVGCLGIFDGETGFGAHKLRWEGKKLAVKGSDDLKSWEFLIY